jgi:hypothetical protein
METTYLMSQNLKQVVHRVLGNGVYLISYKKHMIYKLESNQYINIHASRWIWSKDYKQATHMEYSILSLARNNWSTSLNQMDTSIMYAIDFEERIRSGTWNFWTWNILSFLQKTSDLQPWIKWGTPIVHVVEFEKKDLKQHVAHRVLDTMQSDLSLHCKRQKNIWWLHLCAKKIESNGNIHEPLILRIQIRSWLKTNHKS